MKVFISWSGEPSRSVAIILGDWLQLVVPFTQPYVSAENIDKGSRWATDMAGELQLANFGILCITKENASEPWIHFEAGALAKTVETSRVCPLLLNLRPAEIDKRNPLVLFQATVFEREDVWKLIQSVNKAGATPQPVPIIEKQFGAWWPQLERDVNAALAATPKAQLIPTKPKPHLEVMLEELLDIAREQRRYLARRLPRTTNAARIMRQRRVKLAWMRLTELLRDFEEHGAASANTLEDLALNLRILKDARDLLSEDEQFQVAKGLTLLNEMTGLLPPPPDPSELD
jgi:hypothetical protein